MQENEVVMLLMAIGVLIFILFNRRQIMRIEAASLLVTAFCILVIGYVFTVLEGFFMEALLNFLEHACYAGSSVLIALWCMKAFKRKESA